MKLEQYRVVQWSQWAYEKQFYKDSFHAGQSPRKMSPPENFLKDCRECIANGYVPAGSMGMTVVELDNGTFLCYQQSFYHPNWTNDIALANTFKVVIVSDWVVSGDSSEYFRQKQVINQVMEITELTYEQCQEIVLSKGEVKSGLSREEADDIAEMIVAAGGKVHIYDMTGKLAQV